MRGSPYGQPSDGGGARCVRSYEQSRPQTLPLCLAGHRKLAGYGDGGLPGADPPRQTRPPGEPPRVSRRLQLLRGWSYDEASSPVFPEVRARAVRMVLDHQGELVSQWAAIRSIAEKIGCSGETLRHWVRQAEPDQGVRPGPTTDERERIKALEREKRELRQANEILRKASAYFAQAELDRRFKP